MNNAFRKEPDAEKPHVRNSVRDTFGNGCIYSTITSGILDVKEKVVKEAVQKAGLTLVEVTRQGEWVCVTARKD